MYVCTFIWQEILVSWVWFCHWLYFHFLYSHGILLTKYNKNNPHIFILWSAQSNHHSIAINPTSMGGGVFTQKHIITICNCDNLLVTIENWNVQSLNQNHGGWAVLDTLDWSIHCLIWKDWSFQVRIEHANTAFLTAYILFSCYLRQTIFVSC